ncbi:response regulator [Novosphingobium lentum]|uniref:response regulator n=1 Tax=Novosphingobium lentum TaxID=145287 RepID=UPI00082F4984|nr:response regulator [Novosphingobium lentum]
MATRHKPATTPSLGRALIVEDDALLAMTIADALTDGGATKAVICPSVAAALGELERLRPDVLVLDVHLADRDDGWTLAELVIQLSPKPPIIVFSTGSPENIPAAVAGMGHVLVKPFLPETLVTLVREQQHRPGLFARLRGKL